MHRLYRCVGVCVYCCRIFVIFSFYLLLVQLLLLLRCWFRLYDSSWLWCVRVFFFFFRLFGRTALFICFLVIVVDIVFIVVIVIAVLLSSLFLSLSLSFFLSYFFDSSGSHMFGFQVIFYEISFIRFKFR